MLRRHAGNAAVNAYRSFAPAQKKDFFMYVFLAQEGGLFLHPTLPTLPELKLLFGLVFLSAIQEFGGAVAVHHTPGLNPWLPKISLPLFLYINTYILCVIYRSCTYVNAFFQI